MNRIISVNLGNWFVLERWMKPSMFEAHNVDGRDETRFSNQVENLKEVLDEHYRTWIVKEDILWLKEQGINLVRIPIPWWLFGDKPYNRSVEYIDEALKMISECEMDFMLDLHTAPGCQNGFDNGGIEGQLDWNKDQANIDKTLDVLEIIAKRYKGMKYFHSIQLLNEPFLTIPMETVQQFYIDGYNRLRNILDKQYIVFHDSFRLADWEPFFTENKMEKVILDAHLYQCFGSEFHHFTKEDHIAFAKGRKPLLEQVEKFVPLIIGEWSLGVNRNEFVNDDTIDEVEKAYASAQLDMFKACSGHTFWNYKIENPKSGWNFRSLVERGIIDIKEFTEQ